MRRQRFLEKFLVLGLVFILASCAGQTSEMREKPAPQEKPVMQEKSLYERLGGEPAIRAVVDQFVANVAADNRINQRFVRTTGERAEKFKAKLVDQIGQATGGPQVYTGASMKAAHAGMGITTAEFNALVEDLVAALNKFNVPQKEQNELLAILGPMQADIVEKP